ncbi:MAG: AraC family transcriptional regulator [Christensenellales bacterium]
MLEVQKQKRVSPFSSKLFSRLIAFTAAFLVFALLFGSMFQMFESISMQAMLRMNEEFSAQASTISDSMQSIINTLGIQMFYISSTAKLRKSTSLTQNERVFALRELWQYAMSGSMLHSIYVFNPKLDYVYTTDNDYMSASMDGFYDQDAVALYRQRSPENRMRLYHRTFRENGEDYGSEWYSYLVYEVTASGKTGESAVMLNLNADWFREHLLNFQGENYVIVSSDSYVVASQREELNAMSLSLLSRIGEQKRGYLIERLNGKRTICFFSPLDVNDWYCLRYVAYADCLPGLAKIRSYAWIALTLIACALLSALGVALIRVYDPYRRMTAALNRTHEVENVQQAAEQVEKIVATSLNRKREDALRLWINGQPSEEGLVRFPAVPILLEMSPDERLRGLLAQETPDYVVCAVGEASLALCAPADGQSAVDICLHLATQMHCRCYYGLPIQSPSELPARYQALLERKKLRFYPGQQVFAQTAAESAGKSAEELETALNTRFNAAKTGKEIAFGKLMEQLKGENYENVLFTLKRLDHLLDSALPGDSAARPTLEKLLAAAQTPEDVSARFEPRLEKLLSQQKAQKHNRTQEIVIQINQRLEQGFRDTGIGAQSIAEEMGVSAAYLRKQYLTEAGVSIGDKLNQLRMDEASRLLLETDQPIESIARQIGVENTKYFFVLFKKFKGMTPRQFRCKAETPLL